MFELAILDSPQSDMDVLYERLKKEASFLKGLCLFDEENDRKRISIAVNDRHSEYFWARTREEIVEYLAVEYKFRHFQENLEIPMLDSFLKTAFLSCLAVFDKQTDKKYIESQLLFDKEINLDSFFAFRLPLLRDRWDEICELVKSNFLELAPNGGMIEMMKFLLDSSPVECEEVWTTKENNRFCIANSKKEVVFSFEDSQKGMELLLHRLIFLLPKKVVLKSPELLRIGEVFGNRTFKSFEKLENAVKK